MKPFLCCLLIALLLDFSCLFGQEKNQPIPSAKGASLSDDELRKANDPMAHVKAFNVHDYIVSSLYGLPEQGLNQLIFRYSQPVGPLLLRASMPVVTSYASGNSPNSGFGDFNMFAIYSFPSSSGNKFGVGPSITAPTGTHGLGTGKWQVGLSALAFLANSKVIQVGSLLQWSGSFAGDEKREDITMLTAQMFFIWQLGSGFCLRSTGIWSFNLKNGDYNIPLGLGVGKIVKVDHVVFNIFVEPQFTVAAQGVGQPHFQTFIGFNTQF